MGADMLEELLFSGATTFVAAMATSAWAAAKDGITALFGRKGSSDIAAVVAQLNRHADQVAAASDTDAVRRRLAPSWEVELEALLARTQMRCKRCRRSSLRCRACCRNSNARGYRPISLVITVTSSRYRTGTS